MYRQESEKLRGLPHAARVLYGLARACMNWESFTAENISWGGLALDLVVYPHQGVKGETYSKYQAARLAQWLVKAGLIELRSKKGEGELLKIFFPCVAECKSVQKKAARKPLDLAANKPLMETQETMQVCEDWKPESRETENPESRQMSVVSITDPPTLTRARAFLTRGAGNQVTVLPYDGGEVVITDADVAEAAAIYPAIPDLLNNLRELGSVLMGGGYPFESSDAAKKWLHARLREDNQQAATGGLPKMTKPRFDRGNHATANAGANTGSGHRRNPADSRHSFHDEIAATSKQALAELLAEFGSASAGSNRH